MTSGGEVMAHGDVGVLATTVWEITRKISLGKLPPLTSRPLSQVLAQQKFHLMPLTWDDAEAANQLPDHHRDPMDRLLIAVSLRADFTVITSDRIFAAYGVRTIW